MAIFLQNRYNIFFGPSVRLGLRWLLSCKTDIITFFGPSVRLGLSQCEKTECMASRRLMEWSDTNRALFPWHLRCLFSTPQPVQFFLLPNPFSTDFSCFTVRWRLWKTKNEKPIKQFGPSVRLGLTQAHFSKKPRNCARALRKSWFFPRYLVNAKKP